MKPRETDTPLLRRLGRHLIRTGQQLLVLADALEDQGVPIYVEDAPQQQGDMDNNGPWAFRGSAAYGRHVRLLLLTIPGAHRQVRQLLNAFGSTSLKHRPPDHLAVAETAQRLWGEDIRLHLPSVQILIDNRRHERGG